MDNGKPYKETEKERIAKYKALQYVRKHEYDERPFDPASDGIEEDGSFNSEWMLFWSGED